VNVNDFLNYSSCLGALDVVILALTVGFLFIIAYTFGRKENSTSDYFLGGRKIPPFIACLSFVAAEVSALTIVGVPATAFDENWEYLQFFIGSAAARILVAFLFIPVFYHHNCTSIYEFLRHRFGPSTQYAGSSFFFITRLIGSGVRLYAASMAISYIMDWPLLPTIILFSFMGIVFITFGGIKAVVWTGAYQTAMFYAAGLAIVIFILYQIPGGISEAFRIGSDAGKLHLFNFSFQLNNPTTFWAGSANAFFIGLAVFGTDQELMQRLLTVETRKKSQHAILATIAAGLPITVLYLTVGTMIFVFYKINPSSVLPAESKTILSHFVVNVLPVGLKGLMLSAIVLASIDSPLSSLSSSFVTDIYRPLIRKNADEKHYLLVSRCGVVGFGVILTLLAMACSPVKNILWFAFQIVSITGGSTLGIFLLGLLTKRSANRGNIAAMTISALAMTVLLLLSSKDLFIPGKIINLAWSWLIVIGTLLTFSLGLLFSTKQTVPNEPRP
jgi:SSS family transporter